MITTLLQLAGMSLAGMGYAILFDSESAGFAMMVGLVSVVSGWLVNNHAIRMEAKKK